MTNEKCAVLLFKTNIWIFEAAYLIGINKGKLKISVTLLVKFSNVYLVLPLLNYFCTVSCETDFLPKRAFGSLKLRIWQIRISAPAEVKLKLPELQRPAEVENNSGARPFPSNLSSKISPKQLKILKQKRETYGIRKDIHMYNYFSLSTVRNIIRGVHQRYNKSVL